jgi:hypothetical protein
LTSAAFLRLATHRLYRTGDRVRLLGADRFLYLGRRDDQIKLRGFRIELGEVEAGLRRQAGVQEAAVRLVGEGDEAMLVGYVEAKSGVILNRLALRKGLQATLPHYMVPARLILLDALPKTGSGKLDRKALPLPGVDGLAEPWMDKEARIMRASCWPSTEGGLVSDGGGIRFGQQALDVVDHLEGRLGAAGGGPE